MADKVLEEFGEKFIREVFGYSYVDWQNIISGKSTRGVLADAFKQHFGVDLSAEQKNRCCG